MPSFQLEALFPPYVWLAGVSLQLLLWWLTPTANWPGEVQLAGGGVVLIGLLIVFGTARFLKQRNQSDIRPITKPAHLVQDGIYRYSRNPIYLGLVISQLGLSILLRLPVGLFVTVLVLLLIYGFWIRLEEIILERQYGDEYRQYKQRVRCWL